MNRNQVITFVRSFILITFTLALIIQFSSCSEDPEPTNEEELITTVIIDLIPTSGGDDIQLKFYDADGSGAGTPVITPAVAQFVSGKVYEAQVTLLNEEAGEDITEEIDEEKNDHLFCFTPTNTNVTIGYSDEDDNGRPIGLSTYWTVGDAGEAGSVKVTLRHQPGTKDGSCPGTGDTDVEVTFPVQVVE